jgi:hypothetical protein
LAIRCSYQPDAHIRRWQLTLGTSTARVHRPSVQGTPTIYSASLTPDIDGHVRRARCNTWHHCQPLSQSRVSSLLNGVKQFYPYVRHEVDIPLGTVELGDFQRRLLRRGGLPQRRLVRRGDIHRRASAARRCDDLGT